MAIGVHAYIDVGDLERGIAFYCDGLGLKLRRRLSPRWVELEGAAVPIFLLARERPPGSFERHWTPVHLDFIVSDLDRTVARLTEIGGTQEGTTQTREYGRIAYMADPFGNGFDLIAFSGDGYDGVARQA